MSFSSLVTFLTAVLVSAATATSGGWTGSIL